MPIRIERVRSNRDFAKFVSVPQNIYQASEGYVAPLDREVYSLLHPRRSAFFAQGYASYWLASRSDQPVGRISAQVSYLVNESTKQDRVGSFGSFDAIDDADAISALVYAAENWLRDEGCRRCLGPYSLSINGQSGMLVEGQSARPMIGMPWHPKYLAARMVENGFSKIKALHSYTLSASDLSENRAMSRLAKGAGIQVRRLKLNRLGEESELCRKLFNDAWKDNWGFIPISKSEMSHLMRDIRPLLIGDCAIVVELNNHPIGFLLIIPNVFDAAEGLGPTPSLTGWARIISRVKRLKYESARIILLGISPDQPPVVRAAALAAIFTEAIQRTKVHGGLSIEAGWVLDDNTSMLRILEQFNFSPTRSFHLFGKDLVERT